MTYTRALRRLGWALVAGIAYLVIMSGSTEDLEVEYLPSPGQVTADALVADHKCWTGTAPADIIPGHAVVDVGNGPELLASDVGFGIYLDGDPGMLFAFCP